MTSDGQFMERALALAREALSEGEVPVGAVVVQDGRVIGEGREGTRKRLDHAAHAEVEAVRAACRATRSLELPGATLYTTVEPCLLCSYAVLRSRIERVVYGVPAGPLGGVTGRWPLLVTAEGAPDLTGGVLAAECQQLLAEPRPVTAPGRDSTARS